jgi:O-antigen/teichoic acid export membrane protein
VARHSGAADSRGGSSEASPPAESQRAFLGALAPFAAGFLLMAAYYKSDVLLLSRLASPEQTGLYTAAYRFVDFAQALALVGATAIFPRLARSRARAPGRVLGWALLAVAVPALVLGLARMPVMTGLFGPQYSAAAVALLPLAALLIPLAVNMVAQYLLAAQGRVGRVAVGYAVGLAANLSLGFAFVPELGIVGSGIAKLASETVVALILVTGLELRPR